MSDKLSEEREEALRWFIKVLIACEGCASATEYRGNPLNVFCDDFQPLDTFNLAIERGFTRSTHDSDTDESTVYLTDAGRAFLNAARAEARPAPVVGREAVARIVDPIAFKCWQATYDYGRRIGDSESEALETAEWAHGKSRDEALAKADAILALLSPATSPGKGEAA